MYKFLLEGQKISQNVPLFSTGISTQEDIFDKLHLVQSICIRDKHKKYKSQHGIFLIQLNLTWKQLHQWF
jgi:hypothetical protein